MFLIFFNIAAALIAYTDFFPNTLYGDALDIGDNPISTDTAYTVFSNIGAAIPFLDYKLSFGIIMGVLLLFMISVGKYTNSGLQGMAAGLVAFLFVAMWANSKQALDSIIGSMDSSISYIVLMISVGILIMFVITLMDYAAGQRSAGD